MSSHDHCGHGHGHGGHCDHGHGGHGGHGGDGHDHKSCKDESVGELYSLWQYATVPETRQLIHFRHIDTDNVTCLNEAEPGSIKGVFKTWDKRLDKTKVNLDFC